MADTPDILSMPSGLLKLHEHPLDINWANIISKHPLEIRLILSNLHADWDLKQLLGAIQTYYTRTVNRAYCLSVLMVEFPTLPWYCSELTGILDIMAITGKRDIIQHLNTMVIGRYFRYSGIAIKYVKHFPEINWDKSHLMILSNKWFDMYKNDDDIDWEYVTIYSSREKIKAHPDLPWKNNDAEIKALKAKLALITDENKLLKDKIEELSV